MVNLDHVSALELAIRPELAGVTPSPCLPRHALADCSDRPRFRITLGPTDITDVVRQLRDADGQPYEASAE
jgi:hypothetical protein